MNLLLDTNILIGLVRSKNPKSLLKYLNPDNQLLYISVATEAEIKSFSVKSNWGANRLNKLDEVLDYVIIVDIVQSYVNVYAQIDSFSQRLNPAFTNYNFNTPRNMGKNDLWIASLAALLGLTLVTTDSDFDHLNGIFFDVRRIKPDELSKFL